jgi:hypothetical protein
LAHEAQASKHWWRTVLRKNWFPAAAIAYLLAGLIVLSVVGWDSRVGIYCLVFGVLVAISRSSGGGPGAPRDACEVRLGQVWLPKTVYGSSGTSRTAQLESGTAGRSLTSY